MSNNNKYTSKQANNYPIKTYAASKLIKTTQHVTNQLLNK
jgi:hypothetical protein